MHPNSPHQHLKVSQSEAAELQLDSYVMHIHHTICDRCSSGEQYGELYEVWTHPTKTKTTGFRQLRRCHDTKLKDISLSYIEIPERTVPVCSDCVTSYVSASKPAAPVVNHTAWAETLKRKYAPQAAETRIARASGSGTKQIPTLDEL